MIALFFNFMQMTNKLILSLLISFLSFTSYCQTLNWGFKSNALNAFTVVSSSDQFSNGDILITGHFKGTLEIKSGGQSYSSAPLIRTGFFSRIDTNGNVVWTHIVRGNDITIEDVEIDQNDSIFLLGYFSDSVDLDPSAASHIITPSNNWYSSSIFLAKYDSNGNFDQGRQIEFKGSLSSGIKHYKPRISIDNNSSLILAFAAKASGWVDIDLSNDSLWLDASKHALPSVYIVKYNLSFKYQWHITLHGAYNSTINLGDLKTNINNDILICAATYDKLESEPQQAALSFQASSPSNGALLICLSQTGSFKWLTSIGDASLATSAIGQQVLPNRMFPDPITGSIFVLGMANSPTLDLDRTATTYSISSGAFLAKYDMNGYIKWAQNIPFSVNSIISKNDNFVLSGSYTDSTHFGFGMNDSVLSTVNSFSDGFVSRYDNQGQFLSVFAIKSPATTSVLHVFSTSKSIMTVISSFVGTLDLDPYPNQTYNLSINTNSILSAMASYKLPCLPAKAFDRDTLPDHYDYCSNEYVDLQFPRRASGYSQTSWQMDTGNGFNTIDSSFLQYQIVGESIRFLTKSGMDTTYVRGIISNSCGTDTTETVSLYVRPAYIGTLHYYLCKNDSVVINGVKYFSPIRFNDSLQNILGCDSVLVHDIQQEWPFANVFDDDGALLCNGGYDSYQWINCSNLQPVSGATDSIFTPTDSSQYAVIVSLNGCSDTSQCMRSSIGILEQLEVGIDVFPNPTSGNFTIQVNHSSSNLNGHIRDMTGKMVKSFTINSNKTDINMVDYSPGLYLLEIWDGKKIMVFKKKLILNN